MATSTDPARALAALHVLAAHLQSRADSGQRRIWMSHEARAALKEIIRMKPGRMKFAVKSAGPEVVREGKGAWPVVSAQLSVPDAQSSVVSVELPVVAAQAPAPLAKPSVPVESPALPLEPPPARAATPALSREEKQALLDKVKARAEAGEKARGLGTLRDTMVFATGDPCASLMLVGEAPGADEERLREPFVGRAGKLLDRILTAMGLGRSGVYISNICKFRPKVETAEQRTANRKPTPMEMDACLEFVREEIRIVQPRAMVALGATAAEGLLGGRISVNRERGRWRECGGIPLMITFHPSYLLRQEDFEPETAMAEKRKVWEDMLMVMEKLGMPVTPKQRGYFLKK